MQIQVRESSMVRPAAATPRTSLWMSNLDMMLEMNYHTLIVYFYRFNGASNFFDSEVLKAALSRTLVHFYPLAGRFKWNGNRIEINCNAEGVLFLDAESNSQMDELGDFSAKPSIPLVPAVDYSRGISAYPLVLVQRTQFKCGGVCLGFAIQHQVLDGTATMHFKNTWSDITRGLGVTVPPFFDRRAVLSARNPPRPQFVHVEYQPPPPLKMPQRKDPASPQEALISRRFKLTRYQLDALKAKCNDGSRETNYSTYKVLCGHAWRCITVARGLPEDQVSRFCTAVDGRSRLRPPVPQEHLGNALFFATTLATAGELQSRPLKYAVSKIHDAIARIDHDYTISALDYLELQPDLISIARGPQTSRCPNVLLVSWAKLGMYDLDFGWGRPMFVGPGAVHSEGKIYVMGSPVNDGSLWLAVALPEAEMMLFEKAVYGSLPAGLNRDIVRSRI